MLTHEIGTLYLLAVNRLKESGWSFFDAPLWFAECYQEYIGINLSTDHARKVTQARYLEDFQRDPARVGLDLRVTDEYRDGAVLIRFLHERYGIDAVHGILRSERPAFWEAIEEVTGLTPTRLHNEFQAWALDASADPEP